MEGGREKDALLHYNNEEAIEGCQALRKVK